MTVPSDIYISDALADLTNICSQILKQRAKRGRKTSISAARLASFITKPMIDDTMKGSGTLTLTFFDEDFDLMDSNLFDQDRDGKHDPIDIQYGTSSAGHLLYWRSTMVSMNSDHTLVITFIERTAAFLMAHKGPVKVSRAKRTRAEFLKMLTRRVKAGGGIAFHSIELHKKQKIASSRDQEKKTDKKERKGQGISSDEDLTITDWQGSTYKLKKGEIDNATRVLDAASSTDAGELATKAVVEACIVEAPFFRNPMGGDGTSSGILQLTNAHLGGSTSADGGRRDIEKVVTMFLEDGFAGAGGAIALEKSHPTWTSGQIAQAVQGSGYPDRYDKVQDAAEKVIEAYGGVGAVTSYRRKQYNFEIGSPDEPHENYWDGSNRLAEEVKWAYFVDGRAVYYDAETTLIRQQAAAVIKRDDANVLAWDFDWDTRHIATEMSLTLICEPFAFRAGEVFILKGFGPASTGSTAKPKLPGRWLISESSRDRFDIQTTFTLKQPTRPGPEPAAEIVETTSGDRTFTSDDSPKAIIDTVVIPLANENHINVTPESVKEANDRHGPTNTGNRSDHQGPPETAWAADMSNGSSPTPQMDQLAKDLAKEFDLTWHGSGHVEKTDGGYRFQMIYRTDFGGNHYNHVHFGVKKVS